MTSWTLDALVPPGQPPESFAAEMAWAATGRPVSSTPVTVHPVDYAFGSPATGALLRVRGGEGSGQWSVFVKVLQHVRHWAMFPMLPPELARSFAAEFPWRGELDLWRPDFAGLLPDGLRTPRLFTLVELGDDRVALWMEDVAEHPGPWDLARYARAAALLGRFTARRTAPEVLTDNGYPAGFGLRRLVDGGLPGQVLGPLADGAMWARDPLVGLGDLRTALRRWMARLPALLDRLDTLPQALPHGDASPQNLLVPSDDPESFVVIDASFQTPHALGFDVGQLVAGLVQVDLAEAADLPDVEAAVLSGFHDGLAAEGLTVAPGVVELGYAAGLLIRSGFTALPWRQLGSAGAPPVAHDVLDRRVRLTRHVLATADRWCTP